MKAALYIFVVGLAGFALNLGILALTCSILKWDFASVLPYYTLYLVCDYKAGQTVKEREAKR